MRPFEYHRARDTSEAASLLSEVGVQTCLLAGGTDVLPLMKDGVIAPRRLVDIKRSADLDHAVTLDDEGLRIGALTTLAEIAENALVREQAPLLAEAAESAATPQLRDAATVAGNLLQRPRCWYYRNPAFHCWLAGGAVCHARDGHNERHAIFEGDAPSPCCAVHPSDLAPALIALDAGVRLRASDGQARDVSLETLFRPPTSDRRTETVVGDALVLEIRVPRLAPQTYTRFVKVAARRTWSFALAAVAARVTVQYGRITHAALVLGGVANVPWRARQAEQALVGAPPAEDVVDRAARLAVSGARSLGHNAYKVALVQGLVTEALHTLFARAVAK